MALKHQVGAAQGPRTRVNVVIGGGTASNYQEALTNAILTVERDHGLGKHGKMRKPVRIRTKRVNDGLVERTFVFEV